ncbi:MAG: phosphodiester glycosidase family protein [Clostridia bacterium]|nr:phosphodiester glycosidase family protein [Clostridia bacterium]
MRNKALLFLLFCVLALSCCPAATAEGLEPLPMDNFAPGPMPSQAAYLSPTEYQDESIAVSIYQDRFADTDYYFAHVRIKHPSQLRTAPAGIVSAPNATFSYETENKATQIAKAANAVIALNGDYYTKSEKCHVALRQTRQYRNFANGSMDVLAIDMNGDLHILQNCTKQGYKDYHDQMAGQLYNVFCFGPLLVQDGVSVIQESYKNNYIGSQNTTQRSAIAQLGPLEYMLVSTNGPQSQGNKGMTIYEFAQVCEEAGKRLSENGCLIAYNLDGGNSAAMIFRAVNPESGKLAMKRVNSSDISERHLSDIIYFATLVK